MVFPHVQELGGGASRDWQGFQKPVGLAQGFPGVRVRV